MEEPIRSEAEVKELASPAQFLEGESPSEEVEDGVGICVSGGGYRAMLYHLGAYWRLCELGILGRARRISSVSGGSIVSGKLALEWKNLGLKADGVPGDVPKAFIECLVQPLRRMASTTIDIWPTLLSAIGLVNAASQVAGKYDSYLFNNATLQDLPDDSLPPGTPGSGPRFVINATNLRTGVLWRFSRKFMADYTVGLVPNPTVALSHAVAASSAFPPLLSPLKLKLDPAKFAKDEGKPPQNANQRDQAILTDGGVYDNLGMETVWKRYRTVFVSDAGGGAEFWDPKAANNWLRQGWRVLWVARQQVGGLRRRQLMSTYTPLAKPGPATDPWWRHGTFWSISTPINRYNLKDSTPLPESETNKLAQTPVRLKAMPNELQEALINWGYASCDASVRRWYDPTMAAPAKLPYARS